MRLLRRDPPFLAIGVGYAEQQVARLPREPFDQPLDAIVTEQFLMRFERPVRAA
jgi:5-formyltetrahydrofolate cyclo-ligase